MRARLVGARWGLVLGLLAAACGGGVEPPAIDGLAGVAAATEDAGSARMEFRMEMSLMGQTFTFVGDGMIDTASGDSVMTLRGEGESAALIGENELRTIDDRLFVRGTMAQQYVPGTTVPADAWVSIDVSDAAALASQQQAGMADFGQMLDAMRAADQAEELGTQDVRGASAEGLRATMTMRDLYAQSEISLDDIVAAMEDYQPVELTDAQRDQIREQMESMLDSPVTLTAWVADDGLPRRVSMSVDMSEMFAQLTGQSQQATMAMTFDILEYGIDVDVQAPPSDQVITPT